jgi:tetratricopeptide (TPR) repeat protein
MLTQANHLDEQADVLSQAGNFAQAEALFQQTLGIRERTLGRDHPAVADSFDHLARLYVAQGRYSEAEAINQQALTIREQALGQHIGPWPLASMAWRCSMP